MNSQDAPIEFTQDPDVYPHTGIALAVRWLADRLNGLAVVDGLLPWDRARSRIAPSVLLLTLIINVLTQRNPLYRVQDWVKTLPLELLWGPAVRAEQFNDDAFGRLLEELADHGRRLLGTLGPRMRVVEELGPALLHSDTTAFSVFGDYADPETGPTAPVVITWGHSKDHRPDLKQIMVGLTVDEWGHVLAGDVLNGNTSDKAWHSEWLETLEQELPKTFWTDGHWSVSDAAVIHKKTLQALDRLGTDWLGRLPATYALCTTLKERAWAEAAWESVGALAVKPQAAHYRAQVFPMEIYGLKAMAYVYHSSTLDRQKERTLQREIAREAVALAKAARKLARTTFHCAEDATQAAAAALPVRWHPLTTKILEQTVPQRPPGRPKEGVEPKMVTHYRVHWEWADPDPVAVQRERERRSTFILLTSRREKARTVLQVYKGQDHVEHAFRWAKEPIHLGAFWVHKPARVKGLGFVLLLALQFARWMRAMVRQVLADQPPLVLPYGRTVQQPTEAVILDTLRDLWVLRKHHDHETWCQWGRVAPHTERLLQALGVPIRVRFTPSPDKPKIFLNFLPGDMRKVSHMTQPYNYNQISSIYVIVATLRDHGQIVLALLEEHGFDYKGSNTHWSCYFHASTSRRWVRLC